MFFNLIFRKHSTQTTNGTDEILPDRRFSDTQNKWFLTSRKQLVLVDGIESSIFVVTSGVPKGSVLDLLSFGRQETEIGPNKLSSSY